MYENIQKRTDLIKNIDPIFNIHFVNGAFVEIKNSLYKNHNIKFINKKTNFIEYESNIQNNSWSKTSKSYFVDWKIQIFTDDKYEEFNLNLKNKNVYISLESSALGDNLAWFPYVEEFRKKWNCNVICSTFFNNFFEKTYPNIKFVKPGVIVNNIYAQYKLGWFYNNENIDLYKHPNEVKNQPMQKTASDILGLDYQEIKPNIYVQNSLSNFNEKYVVIAPHASSQAKYWNYYKGWQLIVDYLNNIGYKVVMITKESLKSDFQNAKIGYKIENVIDKTGDNYSLQDRITDIKNATLFIGLGSGLSWLSWSLNTPTILISGFSEPYTEFSDCERIYFNDENTCTGCFNRKKLNASDWMWCPNHQGTDKMFECSKKIKPLEVINSINKLLLI